MGYNAIVLSSTSYPPVLQSTYRYATSIPTPKNLLYLGELYFYVMLLKRKKMTDDISANIRLVNE